MKLEDIKTGDTLLVTDYKSFKRKLIHNGYTTRNK
jgi:hypothetical protein